MEKLENVYVVIYSKKMLKQAVDRLKNLDQKVQNKAFTDFECHDNDSLIFHNGVFKMVQDHPVVPNYEVTLNELCEMVIDLVGVKSKELEDGKWYIYNDTGSIMFNKKGGIGYGINAFKDWAPNAEWLLYDKDNGGDFRLATDEEIKTELIEEAKRRGFGRLTKFTMGKFEYSVPQIFYFKYFPESNTLGVNNPNITGVYYNILQDGEWAKIIEVDKFADLKKAHSDGDIIERKTQTGWVIDVYPQWDHSTEYRIKPEPKVKMGDYVITELKNQPSPGFSAYQLSIQNSVDVLNSDDCQYNFKIISKEKFDELRKEAF